VRRHTRYVLSVAPIDRCSDTRTKS
jgi:hypothetical protein